MKVLPRPRHRHVEQPALLVDLLGFAGCHVRRDAAVHKIEDKDSVPFLPLGGVDGRQDQIVFVKERPTCLCAARIRRIKGQFGQEALAAGVAESNLLQLVEVSGTGSRIIVETLEQRLIPVAHEPDLPLPRRIRVAQTSDDTAKAGPEQSGGGRR